MNSLTFTFDQSPVRVFENAGQAWFLLKDVAPALGYKRNYDASRILDADEKGTHSVRTPGGNQEPGTVSGSGVYHLVFKSRKPAAKSFRKWITSEVLPAIRHQGHYTQTITPEQKAGLKRLALAAVSRNFNEESLRVDQSVEALRAQGAMSRFSNIGQSVPRGLLAWDTNSIKPLNYIGLI